MHSTSSVLGNYLQRTAVQCSSFRDKRVSRRFLAEMELSWYQCEAYEVGKVDLRFKVR